MKGYQFIANNNQPWSFFKKVSENKAKTIAAVGKTIYFADSNGNNRNPVKSISNWDNEKRVYREIWLNRMKPRKNKITYWVPVAWYDRFSGEEVEPFDTVRGLEEYNHRFDL